MQETLIVNAGNRAAGVAANLLCLLAATSLEGLLNVGNKLLGVGLGEGEIEDTLD